MSAPLPARRARPGGRPGLAGRADLEDRAGQDRQSHGRDRYWRSNLRWIAAMLGAWALVGFGVAGDARDLMFSFFGWPFSFYVAAQGAPIVFVLLVALYAWRMSVLDRRHDVSDEFESDSES